MNFPPTLSPKFLHYVSCKLPIGESRDEAINVEKLNDGFVESFWKGVDICGAGRITSRLIEPERREIGEDKGKSQNSGANSWERDDKRPFPRNRSRGPLSPETSTKVRLIMRFAVPFSWRARYQSEPAGSLSNVSRRSGKRWMVVERWNLRRERKRRIKWI